MACALSAQAELGFTKKQCDKAYGKSKKAGDGHSYLYKKGKYQIKVLIIEGECFAISYFNPKGITPAEAKSLMKKYCKGAIKKTGELDIGQKEKMILWKAKNCTMTSTSKSVTIEANGDQ